MLTIYSSTLTFLKSMFCSFITVHRYNRQRYFAKGHSVCSSVRLTGDPRLNGSRYRNVLTLCDGDAFSFLTPNFVVLSSGVAMKRRGGWSGGRGLKTRDYKTRERIGYGKPIKPKQPTHFQTLI